MTIYLYPELPSKAAYKRAIANGETVTASEQTPRGSVPVASGKVTFSGPHYPKPHVYYGQADVVDGKVVKVK